MDKDDLIKRLEDLEVPKIELRGHKERLKHDLLTSKNWEEQPKATILSLSVSRLKGGAEMLREYISRQPLWKTATIGILALTLITVLSITIPSFDGESSVALAEEQAKKIVRNSDWFQDAVEVVLGEEGEIGEVGVVEVNSDKSKARVIYFPTETGQTFIVDVDLVAKEVTDIEVTSETIIGKHLSGAEEQEVIDIARSNNLLVRTILDRGWASVWCVSPRGEGLGAQMILWVEWEEQPELSQYNPIVPVEIDLVRQKVEIVDPIPLYEMELSGEAREEAISITLTDPTLKEQMGKGWAVIRGVFPILTEDMIGSDGEITVLENASNALVVIGLEIIEEGRRLGEPPCPINVRVLVDLEENEMDILDTLPMLRD